MSRTYVAGFRSSMTKIASASYRVSSVNSDSFESLTSEFDRRVSSSAMVRAELSFQTHN
jgi:hypothetical protein